MNRVRPTLKQLKTVELKLANPKMPLGTAMRMAGYARNSSIAPKTNFLELKGTQSALDIYRKKLTNLGITPDFFATKMHEWATATKIKTSLTEPDQTVPDYTTQLAVKEDLKQILDLKPTPPADVAVRRLTIEEFIQK